MAACFLPSSCVAFSPQLLPPCFNVSNDGAVDEPADVVLSLIAANVDCNDPVILNDRAAALACNSADPVA